MVRAGDRSCPPRRRADRGRRRGHGRGGPRRRRGGRRALRRSPGCRRRRRGARLRRRTGARRRRRQPRLRLGMRRRRGHRAGARRRRARDAADARRQPARHLLPGAARGRRRVACRHRPLQAPRRAAERAPAGDESRARARCPDRAGALPDRRRRRRVRLEDPALSRIRSARLGRATPRPPAEVGLEPLRGLRQRRPVARPCARGRAGPRRDGPDRRAARPLDVEPRRLRRADHPDLDALEHGASWVP